MTQKFTSMKALLLLVLLPCAPLAHAQKDINTYKLPATIQAGDYSQVSVLVKWNADKKQQARGRATLSVLGVDIIASKALAPSRLVQKNATWRGPFQSPSKIDIGLYERIVLQPGQNIEDIINKLYASGNFELVEPEFINKMSFTPNDPNVVQQYYLDLINAYEAWDVTKGSEEVVIAIIDSGGDLNHPDLAGNIYTNPDEIAGNGIDDDNDGFIDNTSGWDFVGEDTLNVFNSNFVGDNDPNLKQTGSVGVLTHGVWVAGCAGASANNGVGMAGVGYRSKLLFTKHTADNQRTNSLSVYFGYDGILYAANTLTADNVSRKIINASWGGSFRSQIAQDIITYVSLDLGCLVVAAAGNENSQDPHFPSGYDYVLSVAATTQTDVKATFSNSGYTVDVCAPGVSIFSTQYNDTYGSVQGTSFSCPIVAGAAALVWAHKPELSALQVSEVIRASADASIYGANISLLADKLGKGRLDIQRALQYTGPSVRVSNPRLLGVGGGSPVLGQTSNLSLDFTNYLSPTTSGLTVTLSSSSTLVSIATPQQSVGFLGTNQKTSKIFPVTIAQNTPENLEVNIKISIQDGAYTDFQVITFSVNPSFLDIDENQITSSISSRGRIGFDDPTNQGKGNGFVFNEAPVLYEMGLMMGSSSAQLSNNVRGINGAFDQDFSPIDPIKKIVPGEKSNAEVYGSFANGSSLTNASLQVFYRSYVRKEAPYNTFIILEYKIKNISTVPLTGFRFGLFADWDISGNGAQDAAAWNADKKIGYVFPKVSNDLPHAGIQVLNQNANHYAIDNNQSIANNPFGLYDGYTDEEKFASLSTERAAAGITSAQGNDVSHVVSASPVFIGVNEEVTIAFALHAANNLEELLTSAAHADTLYNRAFTLDKPLATVAPACYGNTASLEATASNAVKWYTSFTGGETIGEGNSFVTAPLFSDTTFYAANAIDGYESVRTKVNVTLKAKPLITSSGPNVFCDGQSLNLQVPEADEYLWSTGATTRSIDVTTAGTYSVTVKDISLGCENTSLPLTTTVLPAPPVSISAQGATTICEGLGVTLSAGVADSYLWSTGETTQSITATTTGDYTVQVRDNTNGCTSTSSAIPVTVLLVPDESFTTSTDLIVEESISFTYAHPDAVLWAWDFGDGATSDQQNPTHTFAAIGAYTVSLTVTYANGCQNQFEETLDIVTSLSEAAAAFPVQVYPNPARERIAVRAQFIRAATGSVELINPQGVVIRRKTMARQENELIQSFELSDLPAGIYLIKVSDEKDLVMRRIVKY